MMLSILKKKASSAMKEKQILSIFENFNHIYKLPTWPMKILLNTKIKRSCLSKKEGFAILLHANPVVAFAINNSKIYNNNLYNT